MRQTARLPSEVEDGLWELLAGGFVTADGFDNLRALVDPKRRRGEGRGSKKRPRHAAGRWALLSHVGTTISPEERRPAFRAPVAAADGASCSAMFWSGKRLHLRGGICSRYSAQWRRAERSAAGDSFPVFRASSLPGLKRSTYCGPSAATQTKRHRRRRECRSAKPDRHPFARPAGQPLGCDGPSAGRK